MDGDVAPLEEIVELARRHDVRVMVDDAHGDGTLGPGGRGTIAETGLDGEVDVIVGTLGKAFGSYGAYVACDDPMARYLVNSARTLMFSTGLPPAAVAAAMRYLVGGPLICLSGVAVMFGVDEPGGTLQGLATLPEFLWELSLGIYPIVWGFRSAPILSGTRRPRGGPAVAPA